MDGNVTAMVSSYGTGIGSGYGFARSGDSKIGNLAIMNGNITASSSSVGSGIGSALGQPGGTAPDPNLPGLYASVVATLSILGGTIRANGVTAGIGSGVGGELRSLFISGRAVIVCNTNTSNYPVKASSIRLSNPSVVFATNGPRVFGASPSSSGSVNLSIWYGTVRTSDTEPLSGLNAPFLRLGNVSLPDSRSWTFCISGDSFRRCIDADSVDVKSLTFSVPSPGRYSVNAMNAVHSGRLETDDRLPFFEIADEWQESFAGRVRFALLQSATPSEAFRDSETLRRSGA
jgi:hypothetical protein